MKKKPGKTWNKREKNFSPDKKKKRTVLKKDERLRTASELILIKAKRKKRWNAWKTKNDNQEENKTYERQISNFTNVSGENSTKKYIES